MTFRKGSCVTTKRGVRNAMPTEPARVVRVRRGIATVRFTRDGITATYPTYDLRRSKECG